MRVNAYIRWFARPSASPSVVAVDAAGGPMERRGKEGEREGGRCCATIGSHHRPPRSLARRMDGGREGATPYGQDAGVPARIGLVRWAAHGTCRRPQWVSLSFGSVAEPVECVVYLGAGEDASSRQEGRARGYLGHYIT